MVSVPAPTSKTGYHTFSRQTNFYYRPTWWWKDTVHTSTPVFWYSNKPPITKGTPPFATDYFRKIGVISSLSVYKGSTSAYTWRGDSAIHNNAITLYGTPYGTSYGSNTVTIPGWMTDKVIQGCIEDLHDLRANILEDFAQALSTVDTMWTVYKLILALFVSCLRKDFRYVRRELRKRGLPSTAANGWLMYYYGIRPLVSTLYALSDSYHPKVKVRTVSRKVTQAVDPKGFVTWAYDVTASGRAEQGAKCGMSVAVNLTADMSMRNALGISQMSDLRATAWALVPYSFVVDWLLPVERFLRTRTWASGLKYQSGYVDKRLFCDSTYSRPNGFGPGTPATARVRALLFERLAYNTYTPPSGLNLKLSLTSTQSVSALALIQQRRG